MKIQRKLSNGQWTDEDRAEHFLSMAASHHNTTVSDITSQLQNGEEIRYRADDWYPYIRIPVERKPRRQATEMVKCDCGHTVSRNAVMNASMGTSCPRCYDRMSK